MQRLERLLLNGPRAGLAVALAVAAAGLLAWAFGGDAQAALEVAMGALVVCGAAIVVLLWRMGPPGGPPPPDTPDASIN
jgi:hypothetical protein